MRRLKRAAVFLGIVFGVALSAGLVVYIPIYQEAVDDATNIDQKLKVVDQNPTVIVSSDGKILYNFATIRRKVIDLRKLPPYVGQAIVAAEDRRFYDHRGVDPIGLGRAAFTALRDRRAGQGGSTISMQIAKLMVNGDARTPLRKLKDIATAQQIENLRSKDEILNLYANYAYYGENAYGLQRAAQVYFGKDAKNLTVGEAAMLARSVRRPGRVNPIKNLDAMIPMRDYVLGVMKEEGWITQGQYDQGIREVPKVQKRGAFAALPVNGVQGYFVHHVLAQLEQDFPGVDFRAGGYRIETTVNYKLQKWATKAVDDVLAQERGRKVNDGAIVVMDSEGQILAEVGGPDYAKRQFNVVTQGGLQPGSAFKAIVYASALKRGLIHPGSYLSNAPIHLKDGRKIWSPQNASRNENAPGYSLESAFAYSINRPAIHTIMRVGASNVVADAREIFGIRSHLDAVPSLALGSSSVRPIEMLEAYSVFMLGGDRVEPHPIVRVIAPDGEVMRTYAPVVHPSALDAQVARQMDEILKGPVWMPRATATYAQAIPNARGKTGTTNDAKDAWFCGYSDGLVAVGWVGNTNSKGHRLPMASSVYGGTVTVKIWTAVMQAARNLGLAKGVRAAPGTSVGVAASVEPEVPPVRETPSEEPPRPDPTRPDPGDAPILNPLPDTTDPASTDPDEQPVGEGTTPAVPPTAPPPKPDPVKTVSNPKPSNPAPKRPPKTDAQPAEVEVEVCVDTGMRAGMYCPETVTRSFPKGRAPRGRCTLHHG